MSGVCAGLQYTVPAGCGGRERLTREVAALLGMALMVLAAGCSGQDGVGSMTQETLLQQINAGTAPLILDVRTEREFAQGHIPGAVNIPHTQVVERLAELGGMATEIVVHCESGRRAAIAEEALTSAGFTRIYHLEGDMAAWRSAQFPLATQ